jgi:hypothetical protein
VAKPMADSTRTWQVATVAVAVLAVGTTAFGYLQYRRADTLAAQLTEAGDEARDAAAEETRLRAQLSAAQDRTNSQAEKLLAAERQVETSQAHAATMATAQPAGPVRPDAAAVQRELPIRLTFHDAIFRSGKVAILQNLSDNDLEIVLDVQTPGTAAHARHRLTVNARGVLRFGPAQGWPFAAGQVVTLNNGSYRPLVQTVS